MFIAVPSASAVLIEIEAAPPPLSFRSEAIRQLTDFYFLKLLYLALGGFAATETNAPTDLSAVVNYLCRHRGSVTGVWK